MSRETRHPVAHGAPRHRAAAAVHAAHRHRHPARPCTPASSPRGWRGATPTGGSTGCTTSPRALDATLVRTAISRSVIDANRDPSGRLALSRTGHDRAVSDDHLRRRAALPRGRAPDAGEIGARAARLLRALSPRHRRRDRPPARAPSRASCCTTATRSARRSRACSPGRCRTSTSAPTPGRAARRSSTARIEAACDASGFSRVTNGRFKGGYTTRHYGQPAEGVHAVQMELACRGYMREPPGDVHEGNWPPPWDEDFAAPLRRCWSACSRPASSSPAVAASSADARRRAHRRRRCRAPR